MSRNDQDVLVLGLGTSGYAAAELALQSGARVAVLDTADSPSLRERAEVLRSRGARVTLEWNEERWTEHADLAVISPGIHPESQLGRIAAAGGFPAISELEYGFRSCSCPIVAVTGTNGKTTTVELTVHCLRHAGRKALAAGNIGLPLCEAARKSGNLDVLVVEVSSFQLERAERFTPLAAALLNVTPDHLDRYPDLDAYIRAKGRLFANMKRADRIVLREELLHLPAVQHCLPTDGSSPVVFCGHESLFAAYYVANDGTVFRRTPTGLRPLLHRSGVRLRGRHNLENVLASLALCELVGVTPESVTDAIGAFAPSPHRLELVTVHGGVRFINDSKATNPDALCRSLEAASEDGAGGKILLIAGGLDKGLEFSAVVPYLAKYVRGVFLIGRCRERLANQWHAVVSCKVFASLGAAVDAAADGAEPGDTVLLAPGCASMDMFRDYAERGRTFCDLVRRRVGE